MLGELIKKLFKYTREHFQREEAVMLACDFPHFRNHQQVHRLLIKQVRENNERLENGQLTTEELLEFLVQWLTEHIQGLDFELIHYCSDKQVQIQKALDRLEQISSGENE